MGFFVLFFPSLLLSPHLLFLIIKAMTVGLYSYTTINAVLFNFLFIKESLGGKMHLGSLKKNVMQHNCF